MQNAEAMIKVLDNHGRIVGTKFRKDIDKRKDVLHCIDVLVIRANGNIVLAKLPVDDLYGNTWATTVASMVREGEDGLAAAKRAMKKELHLEGMEPTMLGEKFYTLSDGVKRFKTTFKLAYSGALKANPSDATELKEFSAQEINEQLVQHQDYFSPFFQVLWKDYRDVLSA